MANDKREQRSQALAKAKKDAKEYNERHINAPLSVPSVQIDDFSFSVGYDAGHAAATAEGIPQSDGWKAIETGLPDSHDWYLVAVDHVGGIQGLTEIQYFGGEFNEAVVAWRELPAPYQRQSSEGE